MKEFYLDLMEIAVEAYSEEHIARYTREVREGGLQEHGYPRLTSNIGILLAHGRCMKRKAYFAEMMELCCREIPVARARTKRAGNDFSVKEIVFCLLEVEAAGLYEKSVTDGWRSLLASIDPYETYTVIAPSPTTAVGNWAAFGAASEQMRKYAGIGREDTFIETQIQSQLLSFDENGMYRDPNEPMVYDFVTPLQLSVALWGGYDGPGKAALEDYLLRAAEPTLMLQSVTGEIPFGGRSNQFLHNETFFAALCEFYASWYSRMGDTARAGQFKSAARLAAESLARWLEYRPVYHIKNRFPLETHLGCEGYGYFDKYMVTMGSWAYLAYRFADDSIAEHPCPAQCGGYVFDTSVHFHKTVLSAGGYFAEYDTNADPHYDSTGLGRIHKTGAPSSLCLSVPCAEAPSYRLIAPNPGPMSISCGVKTADGWHYASALGSVCERTEKMESPHEVSASFRVLPAGGNELKHTCTVNDEGVTLTVNGDGALGLELPIFADDGEEKTTVIYSPHEICVRYRGWRAVYSADGEISDKNAIYANRNGLYRRFAAEGENTLRVHIRIEKE